MNIFVANLNPSTSSRDLQKLFVHYGLVTTVKVIMDHFTGRSKGYGFVEMPNNFEAEEALTELDSTLFMDRLITVKNAQPTGYRISAEETSTRNSSVPSSHIGNPGLYHRNGTYSIKQQQENNAARNFGYRGSGYRNLGQY